MAITPRVVSRAKALLKSDAWKGNHGFTGDGLTAWNIQREFILAQLIEIVTTKRQRLPRGSQHVPECPKSYQPTAGTVKGALWRNAAVTLFCDAVRPKGVR